VFERKKKNWKEFIASKNVLYWSLGFYIENWSVFENTKINPIARDIIRDATTTERRRKRRKATTTTISSSSS